jgi:hypothetical protein
MCAATCGSTSIESSTLPRRVNVSPPIPPPSPAAARRASADAALTQHRAGADSGRAPPGPLSPEPPLRLSPAAALPRRGAPRRAAPRRAAPPRRCHRSRAVADPGRAPPGPHHSPNTHFRGVNGVPSRKSRGINSKLRHTIGWCSQSSERGK